MKKKIYFLLFVIFFVFILLIIKTQVNNTLYLSYGNKYSISTIIKTNLSEKDIIRQYRDYDYVKIDKVVSKTSKYENEQSDGNFGLYFESNDLLLLPEEVKINNIYNYKKKDISINNINKYLKKRGIEKVITSNDDYFFIKTKSKVLYKNKFINLEENGSFKKKNINIMKSNISDIIDSSANVLINMNKNGKFIYGYSTNTLSKISGYNILRHAGSVWSLILYYKTHENFKLKNVIEESIEYLLTNYTISKDNKMFILEKNSSEIKLGGNALALLMLTEYSKVFNNDKYKNICKKLANGIIFMRNKDGSYIHVLNKNLTIKEKFRTVYYDGEATYALLKYYNYSKDEYYFNKAKESIDYFIDKSYENKRDHWISYSINEYIKIDSSEKYINFALLNYTKNRNSLNKESFGPTRLELLLTTLDTYNYVFNIKKENMLLKNFDATNLKVDIENNIKTLFNYYIDEEYAMYIENPNLIIGGFHNLNSNYRMRIDDIQHSLSSLIMYEKLIS